MCIALVVDFEVGVESSPAERDICKAAVQSKQRGPPRDKKGSGVGRPNLDMHQQMSTMSNMSKMGPQQ